MQRVAIAAFILICDAAAAVAFVDCLLVALPARCGVGAPPSGGMTLSDMALP